MPDFGAYPVNVDAAADAMQSLWMLCCPRLHLLRLQLWQQLITTDELKVPNMRHLVLIEGGKE